MSNAEVFKDAIDGKRIELNEMQRTVSNLADNIASLANANLSGTGMKVVVGSIEYDDLYSKAFVVSLRLVNGSSLPSGGISGGVAGGIRDFAAQCLPGYLKRGFHVDETCLESCDLRYDGKKFGSGIMSYNNERQVESIILKQLGDAAGKNLYCREQNIALVTITR